MIFKIKESISQFSGIKAKPKHLMFCKEMSKLVESIYISYNIFILSPTNEVRYFILGFRGANQMKIIDSLRMGHQSNADYLPA